jgi:hypothetical protein
LIRAAGEPLSNDARHLGLGVDTQRRLRAGPKSPRQARPACDLAGPIRPGHRSNKDNRSPTCREQVKLTKPQSKKRNRASLANSDNFIIFV